MRFFHARSPQRTHEWQRDSRSERSGPGVRLPYAWHVHGVAGTGDLRHGPGRSDPGPDRAGHWRLRPDPGDFPDSFRFHFRPHRPPPGDLSWADRLRPRQRTGGQRRFDLGRDRRSHPAGCGGDFRSGHGLAVRPDPRAAPNQGHGHDWHDHRAIVRRRHGCRAVADPRFRPVRIVPRYWRHGAVRHRDRDVHGAALHRPVAAP
ncbi:hypothetical protein D3C72_800320 [compost metagenome]